MTRGRKPAPTAAKRLSGNPGKRRLNDNEPQFGDMPGAAPAHLSRDARLEWARLSCELAKARVLTAVDTGTLEAYCEAYSMWLEAKKIATKEPVVENSRGDTVVSPHVRILNMAVQQMIRLASELGITPASRSRIRLPNSEEDDEFAQFIKGTLKR